MENEEFLSFIESIDLIHHELDGPISFLDLKKIEENFKKNINQYLNLGLIEKADELFNKKKQLIENEFEKYFLQFKLEWRQGNFQSAKNTIEHLLKRNEFDGKNNQKKLARLNEISESIEAIDDSSVDENYIHKLLKLAIATTSNRERKKDLSPLKEELNLAVKDVILFCHLPVFIAMSAELYNYLGESEKEDICFKYWQKIKKNEDLSSIKNSEYLKSKFVNMVQIGHEKQTPEKINLGKDSFTENKKIDETAIMMDMEEEKDDLVFFPFGTLTLDFVAGLIASKFFKEAEKCLGVMLEKSSINEDEYNKQIILLESERIKNEKS